MQITWLLVSSFPSKHPYDWTWRSNKYAPRVYLPLFRIRDEQKSSWYKSDSVLLLWVCRIAGEVVEESWLQALPTSHVGKTGQSFLAWMMMKNIFSRMWGSQTLWLFCRGNDCQPRINHPSHSFCVNKALAWLLSGDNQLGNHREEVPEPGMDAISFISWHNYLTVTIP